VTDRGVRPLSRGGAFVAGADDGHSIWYNPAGLANAGRSFLVDASFVGFTGRYTRRAEPMMGTVVEYPTVVSAQQPLAIPTIVVTHNFGLEKANFAFGLFAPNAVIPSYPRGSDELPAPQRYSLYSLNGSILAMTGLYASYKPSEAFSFGGGIVALAGSFVSELALSGCPATVTCQPEDTRWDATAQISAAPIFSPTAAFGVQFHPHERVNIGLSGQLPFWVDAPAKLKVRLPSHPYYDGATTVGDSAAISFMLAPIVRAGVEVRPTRNDRIELSLVWEMWFVHDVITLRNVQNGIRIENVRGVGTYQVGGQNIVRNWQNAFSIRLGYERTQSFSNGWKLSPRAGFSYDSSASGREFTSVLTLDADKFVFSGGAGFGRDRWRIDAGFSFIYAPPVNVSTAEAMIPQVAPFRASRDAPAYSINAGRYELSSFVLGAGFDYRW
jgi:long-chain fatty acid transport protein